VKRRKKLPRDVPSSKAALITALRQRSVERIKTSFFDIMALDAMDPVVAQVALDTCGSARAALEWLTSPEISLAGRTPLSLSKRRKGSAVVSSSAARVVVLLKRIDRGIAC
jgi:uncharacterized protein (DUF2384 family)